MQCVRGVLSQIFTSARFDMLQDAQEGTASDISALAPIVCKPLKVQYELFVLISWYAKFQGI